MSALSDEEFGAAMARIRKARSEMSFSRRVAFDIALQPLTHTNERIAYPDALYHIKAGDVERAFKAASPPAPTTQEEQGNG